MLRHRLLLAATVTLAGCSLFGDGRPPSEPPDYAGIITNVRHGRPEQDTLRVVLDLQQSARINSFLLEPTGQYGHRLAELERAYGERGVAFWVERADGAVLVDGLGRFVWGSFPRMDSDPFFCALLTPGDDGGAVGSFDIELMNFASAEQAYVENTAILKTTLRDKAGGVRRRHRGSAQGGIERRVRRTERVRVAPPSR